MPRIKRWFPVDQDINHNPKMRELMREFGLAGFRVWLEILSIGDRCDGVLDCTSLGAQLRLTSASETKQKVTTSVIGWLHNRGCLQVVDEQNHLSQIVKYAEYHKTREPKKIPTGKPLVPYLSEPNLSEPFKDTSYLPEQHKSAAPAKEKVWSEDDQWLKKFLDTQTLVSAPREAFDDPAWWEKVAETTNGISVPFLTTEFAKIGAWLMENPSRTPIKTSGWRRFTRGWLERAADKRRLNGHQARA